MNHLERALDGTNQWWKYLVVFFAAFLGAQFVGAIPLIIAVLVMTFKNGGTIVAPPSNVMDFSAYGIHPNVGLALMLLIFVVALVFMVILIVPLHKRSFAETVNGTKKVRWGKCLYAFFVWGLIMTVYLGVSYVVNPNAFVLNFTPSNFFPLVAIALLLLPFQTTFEELFFRGYLAQGIASWTQSRWAALLVPSVLFGLMHLLNPEVKTYGFWLMMPQYIIFGVIFGLAAVLDDGIETAMGAHAANNIFLAIFVTNESSALQTPSLFIQESVDPVAELWSLLLLGTLFIVVLKLKYKWDLGILSRKVEVSSLSTNKQ